MRNVLNQEQIEALVRAARSGGQLAPIGKTCATLPGQDAIAGGDYCNYLGTQAMASAIPGGAGFGIARFIEARLSRGKEAG